ncbi:MAG: hypothetical protein AAGU02_01415 [Lawsonibacter sp.]
MELTVYEPLERKGQEELRRRVARAHARGVAAAIGELSCPKEQKTELLRRIGVLCREGRGGDPSQRGGR